MTSHSTIDSSRRRFRCECHPCRARAHSDREQAEFPGCERQYNGTGRTCVPWGSLDSRADGVGRDLQCRRLWFEMVHGKANLDVSKGLQAKTAAKWTWRSNVGARGAAGEVPVSWSALAARAYRSIIALTPNPPTRRQCRPTNAKQTCPWAVTDLRVHPKAVSMPVSAGRPEPASHRLLDPRHERQWTSDPLIIRADSH
jgi:hypothetical protein